MVENMGVFKRYLLLSAGIAPVAGQGQTSEKHICYSFVILIPQHQKKRQTHPKSEKATKTQKSGKSRSRAQPKNEVWNFWSQQK